MKITFDLDEDQIVTLLKRAAVTDTELPDQNLDKPGIRVICRQVIRESGLESEGWNDGMDGDEEAVLNGWAYAQARKYTW